MKRQVFHFFLLFLLNAGCSGFQSADPIPNQKIEGGQSSQTSLRQDPTGPVISSTAGTVECIRNAMGARVTRSDFASILPQQLCVDVQVQDGGGNYVGLSSQSLHLLGYWRASSSDSLHSLTLCDPSSAPPTLQPSLTGALTLPALHQNSSVAGLLIPPPEEFSSVEVIAHLILAESTLVNCESLAEKNFALRVRAQEESSILEHREEGLRVSVSINPDIIDPFVLTP